jgi:hypothetical protein
MALLRKFAVPCVLAIIGLIIGLEWSNLNPLIQPLLANFAAFLGSAEAYIRAHPLESGTLFAITAAR